jgi:hypothetical protein
VRLLDKIGSKNNFSPSACFCAMKSDCDISRDDGQNDKFCRMGDFMKYSHSKAMSVFYKIVKLANRKYHYQP